MLDFISLRGRINLLGIEKMYLIDILNWRLI